MRKTEETEKLDHTTFESLESAALKKAKENAIALAIDAKAKDYGRKVQLFISYETDARTAQKKSDKLRVELKLENEEIARLFPIDEEEWLIMSTIKVIVGRIDNNKAVNVDKNSTILEAMQSGGFHPAGNEGVRDIDNNNLSLEDTVEPEKGYFLVHKVKSGNSY